MIERKRRNDFVRKREFDMLRKVRREGLSREQLAALGGSSRLDDSEASMPEAGAPGRRRGQGQDRRDRAADGRRRRLRRAARRARPRSTTRRRSRPRRRRRTPAAAPAPLAGGVDPTAARAAAARRRRAAAAGAGAGGMAAAWRRWQPADLGRAAPAHFGSRRSRGRGQRGRARPRTRRGGDRVRQRRLRGVRAVAGDADRHRRRARPARRDLAGAVRPVPRHRPAAQFESLALDYAQQFGWSAPQWFSLPKLVAEAAARGASRRVPRAAAGEVGWVCPDVLDTDAVARAALADAADAAAVGVRLGALQAGRRRSRRRSCPSCSASGPASRWRCAGWRASDCFTVLRTPRRPACATPTRRSGCCGWTRCGWPTGPTSSTKRRSTTA